MVKNQVIINHAQSNILKQMCQIDFNYITLRILLFVGVYICVINFNEANKLLSMYLKHFRILLDSYHALKKTRLGILT